MRCCVLALVFALASAAALAQSGDRLRSADCQRALDSLQAHEADALAKPPGLSRQAAAKELSALRREAARICLGGTGEPPPPSARHSQPVTLLPIVPPPRPTIAPPVLPQLPPVSLPRLESVTSCDASGCWSSDGTYLPRLGPDLVGPRGVCTVQGALLRCP